MAAEVWWQSYGSFAPGEDGLPHMGHLISHFGRTQGYKTRELAERLTSLGWKIGERRMEQLMSDANVSDPQQISRRKLLSRVLAIPPALLGLSYLDPSAAVQELLPLTPRRTDMGVEAFIRFESVLAAYWDSFYHTSVRRNAEGLKRWQQHIEDLASDVSGEQRQLVLALLCRFDQLLAVTARDDNDLVMALHYHNQSILIAKELKNAELIASSLFRRAKTLLRQQRVERAMDDMTEAVKSARGARDNLRGYVFQMAGEVVTRLPKSRETEQQFYRLMDAAGRILRSGRIEDDGSGAQFNEAGYHQDRARGYLRLGETEAALDAITLADQRQSPHMARWHIELRTLRARAYAESGEPDWACQQLEEAQQLVPTTQSAVQRQNIRDVYQLVAARYPREVRVRQLAPLITG